MEAVTRGRRGRLRARSVLPGDLCAHGPADTMVTVPHRAEDRPHLEPQLLLGCAQRDVAGQVGLGPRLRSCLQPLIRKKNKSIRKVDKPRPVQHGAGV